jgi:hypothetical protein
MFWPQTTELIPIKATSVAIMRNTRLLWGKIRIIGFGVLNYLLKAGKRSNRLFRFWILKKSKI